MYVPVRLKEEVSSVHTKLATELRDMRDRGEFAGEDELPAVTGSKFDISHKGKLLDTHNTVKLENLQWKAEVQLENRREYRLASPNASAHSPVLCIVNASGGCPLHIDGRGAAVVVRRRSLYIGSGGP